MDANTWTTVSYGRNTQTSSSHTSSSQIPLTKYSSFKAEKPAWVAAEERRAEAAFEAEKRRIAAATSFTSDDVYPTLSAPRSVAGGGGATAGRLSTATAAKKTEPRHYARMVAEMAARENAKAIEKVREENIKRYSMNTTAHRHAKTPTRTYDMGPENIDEYSDEEDYAPVEEEVEDADFNGNLFKGY